MNKKAQQNDILMKPINFEQENKEMNELFNLFPFEKKALNEKLKTLDANTLEYWEAKIRLVMVNACIKHQTFTPPFDIDKSGIYKLLENKLFAVNKQIKKETDELKKTKLKYEKLLVRTQINNKQLTIMLYAINPKAVLKSQIDIKNKLIDKLKEIGITYYEKANFEKELFEVEEYINAVNQVDLTNKEKLNRVEKLKTIEENILNQMVKLFHDVKLSEIEYINQKIAIHIQKAEIEQLENNIFNLRIKMKLAKPKLEHITLKEGENRIDEQYKHLERTYLKLIQEKYNYYKDMKPTNDIERFDKARNIHYLGIEIEAKKEFLYFYLLRKNIVRYE